MEIRLLPETIFVEHEKTLTVISSTKHKRLTSNWVKVLHERLYPILLKGCSKKLLFDSVDESKRVIIKTYLNALKQCGALVFDNRSNKALFPEELHAKYNFLSFSLVNEKLLCQVLSKNKEIIVENDSDAVICVVNNNSFLPLVNDLLNAKLYKKLVFLITDFTDVSVLPFSVIINWLKMILTLPSHANTEMLIYELTDINGLNCSLKLQKSFTSSICLSEIHKKIKTIDQHQSISQVPLVFAKVREELYTKEIVFGLNYNSIFQDLAVKKTVQQILSVKEKEKKEKRKNTRQQLLQNLNYIITSASKIELHGKILDFVGNKFSDFSESSKCQLDGLNIYKGIPEINYLQQILQSRFFSLPVIESRVKCLFRYEINDFSAVSICKEKALFELLLKVVKADFYPVEKEFPYCVFYSGFAPFLSRPKLKELVKKSNLTISLDFKLKLPQVNRIETFWGNYFWSNIQENENMTY
jgi:hypothetical protein